MKIRLVNWINLFVFVLDVFAAIFGFITGQVIMPILCIVAGVFNLYVFLSSVSLWWEKSARIQAKYRFKCKYCGYNNMPSFWRWLFVPHIGSKRYLKCEACGDRHFMRRK